MQLRTRYIKAFIRRRKRTIGIAIFVAFVTVHCVLPSHDTQASMTSSLWSRIAPCFMQYGCPTVRPETCSACFYRSYKYLIKPTQICPKDQPLEVVFLITTIHEHTEQRKAIRDTWLSITKNNTAVLARHVFLLGYHPNPYFQDIMKVEQAKYGDFLQQDFTDVYRNMTLKTLMALEWAAEFCPKAKYVIKMDDDVYVNIANLLKSLRTDPPKENEMIGRCFSGSDMKVWRISNDWRRKVKPLEYPKDFYPPFCSGTAYVIPRDVVVDILAISPSVPFYHLEDVYIGLCMEQLGYASRHVDGYRTDFVPWRDSCDLLKDAVTIHGASLKLFYEYWTVCQHQTLPTSVERKNHFQTRTHLIKKYLRRARLRQKSH